MMHPAALLKTAPAKAGAAFISIALIASPLAFVAMHAGESYAEDTAAVAADALPYSLEEASGIPGFDAAMAFLNGNDVSIDRLREVDLAALGSLYPELASAIANRIAEADGAGSGSDGEVGDAGPEESGSGTGAVDGDADDAFDADPGEPDAPGQEGVELPCAPGSDEDASADEPYAAAPGDVVDPGQTDPFAQTGEYPEWSYEGDATYIAHHYTDDWDTERFIAVIGEQARQAAQEQDVYASIMIAQAIEGSRSGLSTEFLATNDLFGLAPYDEGTAATQAAVAMYQAQTPVHPLAGVAMNDEGRVRGELSESKAAQASEALVATLMQPAEGAHARYGSVAESLAGMARRMRILGQVPGSQIRQSQCEDWQEALTYLVCAGAVSEDEADRLGALIDAYDLARFDDALPYELAQPICYTETDALTGEQKQVQLTLADLVGKATSYLGVPYVWGGSSPDGFDCSGLVQYSYRHALGLDLPRTSYYQCVVGEDVDFVDLHMGDLLFFAKEGVVGHVAMYLGDGYYIEAPQPGATVKISSLEEKKPTFAKRVLPTVAVERDEMPEDAEIVDGTDLVPAG